LCRTSERRISHRMRGHLKVGQHYNRVCAVRDQRNEVSGVRCGAKYL
jgi:hypothetical protein